MPQNPRWSASLLPARPWPLAGARAGIRQWNVAHGRRILVLDDDPTGSQAVHGVDAVFAPSFEVIARSLSAPGSTCFVLTNSRSLPEREALALNLRMGRLAADLERHLGGSVDVVSRSDSTLRGHLKVEVDALVAARRATHGQPYDAVLLAPSYIEAGRFTAGDVHWARIGAEVVAVGDTEFSRDPMFGYTSSRLPDFVAEKYSNSIAATDVRSLSLADIRLGGPDRVAEVLTGLPRHRATFVVVNAVDYADLDVVALGTQHAVARGRSFLYRTGPSFVPSLAGLPQVPPLTVADLGSGSRSGHGLVVVGSYVELSTRQVAHLLDGGDLVAEVVDAEAFLGDRAPAVVAAAAERVDRALDRRDVVLMTSRRRVAGADGASSLDIARAVSAGLVAVVDRVARRRLPWIVTKGGITSHDILAGALGVHRAEVVGQLFPGFVSVLRPLDARPEAVGVPCVVFAGNVGDETTLRTAVRIVRG